MCSMALVNITSQSDIDHILNTCASGVSGSVNITTSDITDIKLDGLTAVGGDIHLQSATNVATVSSTTLKTIGGTLRVDNQYNLSSIDMPQLSILSGIWIVGAPLLNGLNFAATGVVNLSAIGIAATALKSLPLFYTNDPLVDQVSFLTILNNPQLAVIELWTPSIETILMYQNHPDLNVTLPILSNATSIAIAHAAIINFHELQTVGQNLAFRNNTFSELSLPALNTVGTDFEISNNTKLTSLTLPALDLVKGNLTLSGNALSDVLALDRLSIVQGRMDIEGLFSKFATHLDLQHCLSTNLWVVSQCRSLPMSNKG